MNPDVAYALEVVALVAGTVVVFYGFYRIVTYFFPGWGTIITNATASIAVLTEALRGVPWHYILNTQQVSYVTFGLFIVNMLMRITKSPVDMPKLMGTEISIK